MYLDYVVHPLYTQINYCAVAHGRHAFYSGGWVENQSMAETTGSHPYLALSSGHKGGFTSPPPLQLGSAT